jgi:AcrR family transcriptional regulator
MSRRVRRTAEEARRHILDAAEKRLAEGGPEALRLQEIARDVGVSHPAILHHFGSRAGLVNALARRATERLESELLEALGGPATGDTVVGIVERVFEALTDTGQARLLSWLALSGEGQQGAGARHLRTLADAIHQRRSQAAREQGAPPPEREDSYFLVRLATAAMLGEGAGSAELDRGLGTAGDADARRRFRAWFGRLLLEHVATGSA